MPGWFRQLDDLLRGKKTEPDAMGVNRVDLPLGTFLMLAILMGAVYGFCAGWFAWWNREEAEWMQVVASVVKIPALFLLTLVVTFPSLYVFNALVGCRLSVSATLRLLVGAVVVNLTVAASLGTILVFFTCSTTSYPFIVVLNVVLLGIGGIVGLAFLLHTLRRLAAYPQFDPDRLDAQVITPSAEGQEDAARHQPGPLEDVAPQLADDKLGQARFIFRIWVILYALVGVQMAWLLRPFIGSPDMPFTWFRDRQGNFFIALLDKLEHLLGG